MLPHGQNLKAGGLDFDQCRRVIIHACKRIAYLARYSYAQIWTGLLPGSYGKPGRVC